MIKLLKACMISGMFCGLFCVACLDSEGLAGALAYFGAVLWAVQIALFLGMVQHD